MSATGKPEWGLAALVILAVLALVGWRLVSEGRAELAKAATHHEAGQVTRASEHYRRSLRWSLPFGPTRAEAIGGLESLARSAEADGDRAGALLAWRSLLGGLAARRFLYSPANPSRERAKDELARLVALDEKAAIDAGLSPERVGAEHRDLLDREASPDPLWGTFLLAGFALWIVSLVLLIRRGFDPRGRPRWPEARTPIWGALVGFASFVLGLIFA